MDRKVKYFEKLNDRVICKICPHNCKLSENATGICGVRHVKGGELYAANYGEISSLGLDPIEKKPLFNYKPGSVILSCGSYGCNFKCGFCQNYTISQRKPSTKYMSPEDMAEQALSLKDRGNIGIAFTYNEPFMLYEYMLDAAKLCKDKGLDVIVVTNGFVNMEPLEEMLPYVDAINIDLKSFRDSFYRDVCKGRLDAVLKNIERANKSCHVELTTLVITGYNDSEEEMEELTDWVCNLDKNIPLHISRYHPAYKFTAPSTDIGKIVRLSEIAKKKLNYVYIGNIGGLDNNTYCPSCGNLIVERDMYMATVRNKSDLCENCGELLNIVL